MIKYETPEQEIIYFEAEDIITDSNNGEGDGDISDLFP